MAWRRAAGTLLAGLALVVRPARAQEEYSLPAFAGRLTGEAAAPEHDLTLWYRRPAEKWVEALPLGNGRLGAMAFGGVVDERLQLNEDTLWGGGPYNPANPGAAAALPEARRLVFAGRFDDAEEFIGQRMMAKPLREMPYQPLGTLALGFPAVDEAADYRRDLNIADAVASVAYSAGGVAFRREMFVSAADQVMAVRLTADAPGEVTVALRWETPQQAEFDAGESVLTMRGVSGAYQGVAGAVRFEARVRILHRGGAVKRDGDALRIVGADEAVLLVAAATSYRNYQDVSGDPAAAVEAALRGAAARSYEELKRRHVAEHRRLFDRASLAFEGGDAAARRKSTDERIRDFARGDDPQLAALYFQFARYLLIASSRPGDQPANLQGIWNWQMQPPWESKYTININAEMNYWAAEVANLAECHEPLFALIDELAASGSRTARAHYGARGWVAHHNTDLWRGSGPVDGPAFGTWPCGGAWLCEHVWEHYLFAPDRKFLERRYPALRGAAEFFLDALVAEPKHGWLVTCPSLSPENSHPGGDTSICAGPTMDCQIIRDLLTHAIEAAAILDVDADLRAQWAQTRDRLPPNQIGRGGQLQEWMEDWDLDADDLHHRHVSHLYGFYPSSQITLRGTPELAAAVRRSLELRGDEATGWGLAWRLNLWARQQDAEHAYALVAKLISPRRTYPNMFDAHPPFQIDGNFGGAAGIAEMLLQSHAGEIELLPALPTAWPTGSARGLRARGDVEIDLHWRDGKLTQARLRSARGGRFRIRYGAATSSVDLPAGVERAVDGALATAD